VNLIDPIGFEVLMIPGYGGVQSMTPINLGFTERPPDYYALNMVIGNYSQTIERDSYGSWYWSPVGLTSSVLAPNDYDWGGVSFVTGWIENPLSGQSQPTRQDLEIFLTGLSGNISGGYILGGGSSFAADMHSLEIGLFTPQIGLSSLYSFRDDYPCP
jgi:hypothetical protein